MIFAALLCIPLVYVMTMVLAGCLVEQQEAVIPIAAIGILVIVFGMVY